MTTTHEVRQLLPYVPDCVVARVLASVRVRGEFGRAEGDEDTDGEGDHCEGGHHGRDGDNRVQKNGEHNGGSSRETKDDSEFGESVVRETVGGAVFFLDVSGFTALSEKLSSSSSSPSSSSSASASFSGYRSGGSPNSSQYRRVSGVADADADDHDDDSTEASPQPDRDQSARVTEGRGAEAVRDVLCEYFTPILVRGSLSLLDVCVCVCVCLWGLCVYFSLPPPAASRMRISSLR
jgi:hypothetical protein